MEGNEGVNQSKPGTALVIPAEHRKIGDRVREFFRRSNGSREEQRIQNTIRQNPGLDREQIEMRYASAMQSENTRRAVETTEDRILRREAEVQKSMRLGMERDTAEQRVARNELDVRVNRNLSQDELRQRHEQRIHQAEMTQLWQPKLDKNSSLSEKNDAGEATVEKPVLVSDKEWFSSLDPGVRVDLQLLEMRMKNKNVEPCESDLQRMAEKFPIRYLGRVVFGKTWYEVNVYVAKGVKKEDRMKMKGWSDTTVLAVIRADAQNASNSKPLLYVATDTGWFESKQDSEGVETYEPLDKEVEGLKVRRKAKILGSLENIMPASPSAIVSPAT